ncbi:MAG: hypothetical protein RIR81_527 [Actinomycetota bacterium]
MPNSLLAKQGNWIHLHRHPCISGRDFSRVAFCGAFFISGWSPRNPAGRAGGFDKGVVSCAL